MAEMRSRLDRIEKLFMGTGNYPCDIAEYSGKLSESALAEAYVVLSNRYPALSAKIIRDEGRCEFYAVSVEDGRLRFMDGNALTLRREIRELRGDDSDAARLIVIRTSSDSGFVGLCVNHSLFDFPSFGFLFNKLWELYTRIYLGEIDSCRTLRPTTRTLPLSPEKIITDRWIKSDVDVPNAELLSLKGKKRRRVIECTTELNAIDTSRFMSAARKHSVSVHSLVCASILMALRDHDVYDGAEPMVCRSAVNLRNRISPNIHQTETTVLQGSNHAEVKVSYNSNLYKVASDIKMQLNSDIENRSLKMIWERVPRLESRLSGRLSQALVTNWGVLPKPKLPCDLELVDRLMGWLEDEEVAWIGANPVYILGTYRGKLKIVGWYSSLEFNKYETKKFHQRILARLRDSGSW